MSSPSTPAPRTGAAWAGALLAATLVAGQLLIDGTAGSWRTREALMLMDVLGANAPWVVAATALSVTIALTRHLVDRHRARRA